MCIHRLALITYSGQVHIHFKFGNPRFGNNTAVTEYLNGLKSIKSTTATHVALQNAYELIKDNDSESGTVYFFIFNIYISQINYNSF